MKQRGIVIELPDLSNRTKSAEGKNFNKNAKK
jgi:hypothetical protein